MPCFCWPAKRGKTQVLTLLCGFSKHAHSLNEAKYGEFIATDKSVIIDIDLKHCLSRYLNKVTNSIVH